MPRRPIVLSGILLLATLKLASAQTQISGTVTDADTGEPLPAASIQVEGTLQGSITNAEGAFRIDVQKMPATLLVRFIGYKTGRIPVTSSATSVNVQLQPSSYQLEELVVTDEDPGREIMRKVIERKQEWRANLVSWKSNAYNRLVLSNDTGIVWIVESLSEAFWDKEKGLKEIALGQRQTDNMNIGEMMPAALLVENLYDDNLEIAGYDFMGPTHPKALGAYRFTLEGTRAIDDQLVYDIKVTPRNKLVTAFRGSLSVLDGEFAVLEMKLVPNESFLFPAPISEFTVAYEQQFNNFGTDHWLPVDFRSSGHLRIGIPGLRFPDMKFSQVARLTDYDVNAVLPDTLFAKSGDEVVVDSTRLVSEEQFEEAAPLVPLSTVEAEAYEEIDSTMTMTRAFKPSGAFARFVEMSSNSDESGSSMTIGPEGEGSSSGFSWSPKVWFNRVDGLFAGAAGGFQPTSRLQFGLDAGYALASKKLMYGADISYDIGRLDLTASYWNGTDATLSSRVFSRDVASIAMILGRPDYFNYVENHRLRLRGDYRVPRLPVRLSLGWNAENHTQTQQREQWTLLGERGARPNAGWAESGSMTSVSGSIEIGEMAPSVAVVGGKGLLISFEKAFTAFGGNFDFWKVQAEADWRIPTFFSRRLLPNALDLKVKAWASGGPFLPIQKYGAIETPLPGLDPFGTIYSPAGHPVGADAGAGFFWEHHFRTVPFEILGLRKLAEDGTGISVYGAHMTPGIQRCDPGVSGQCVTTEFRAVSGNSIHQIGVSLHSPLGLPIRLNLTKGLDRPGLWFGIGLSRLF